MEVLAAYAGACSVVEMVIEKKVEALQFCLHS